MNIFRELYIEFKDKTDDQIIAILDKSYNLYKHIEKHYNVGKSSLDDLKLFMKQQQYDSNNLLNDINKNITNLLLVPAKKGQIAEMNILNLLSNWFPSIQFEDTHATKHSGDIQYMNNGKNIVIDIKKYKKIVPSSQITKLMEDINSTNSLIGIMISIDSQIQGCQTFIVEKFNTDRFIILVSNADESTIKSAIYLANYISESKIDTVSNKIDEIIRTINYFRNNYNIFIQQKKTMIATLDVIDEQINGINMCFESFVKTITK